MQKHFKALLIIQIITLILVIILVVNNLSRDESNLVYGTSVPISNTLPPAMNVDVSSLDDFTFGAENAPNFLIIFSRYDCDYCRYFYSNILDSLKDKYIDRGVLKVVCKDFVDKTDKQGFYLSQLAEVARQTNHFEGLHKLLIKANLSNDSMYFNNMAINAGITKEELENKINSSKTIEKIRNDYGCAKSLNISGTPSFVLNGKVHIGYMTMKDIEAGLIETNFCQSEDNHTIK